MTFQLRKWIMCIFDSLAVSVLKTALQTFLLWHGIFKFRCRTCNELPLTLLEKKLKLVMATFERLFF